MLVTIEVVADEVQGGYTARVPDVPVFGEGPTAEEAVADLKAALRDFSEIFGLAHILECVRGATIRFLAWDLSELQRDAIPTPSPSR